MLVLIVTVSLFGISAYIVGDSMALVRRNIDEQDARQRQAMALAELSILLRSKAIAYLDDRLSGDGGGLRPFEEWSARASDSIREAIAAETADERKARLERVRELDEAFGALAGGRSSPQDAARLRDEMLALLDGLLEEAKADAGLAADRTHSQLRGNALVLVFSIVISAAVGLTLVVLVSRNVKRSLHEVVRMADGIAGRDLLVPDMEYLEKDEIGRLADSMNRMKRTLREMMESISDASTLVSGESKALIAHTGRAGEGSRVIARTMERLSRRSREQADASSQLAGRMDRFAERILAVADEKDRLAELSLRMLDLTEEGGESMRATSRNMQVIDAGMDESLARVRSLAEKTGQVSEIVGAIRDIADQTSLLALNAAIEAARAGEHGRSFAVVAENIRKLSERVQTSAAHIAAVLEDIRTETEGAAVSLERGSAIVKEGGRLMERTDGTFLELKAQIGRIGEQIGRMSASLDEIRDRTPEIRQFLLDTVSRAEETAGGVTEVSAIAGEFDAFLGEVERSVHGLDREAGRLSGLVRQFHL